MGQFTFIYMVPEAGLEPARYRYRRILSPLRLPVSPLGHCSDIIYYFKNECNVFLKNSPFFYLTWSEKVNCELQSFFVIFL